MTDDIRYFSEEYKKLLETEENGKEAEMIRSLMLRFCDSTVSACKDRFVNLSRNFLSNIDEKEIFVLQLNIYMAEKLKTFVEQTVFDGKNAGEKLKEYR